MLLVKFCVSCGAKHEYTLAVPNFCHFCGTPMQANTANASTNKPTFTVPEPQQHQPLTKAPKSVRSRLLSRVNQQNDPDDETEIDGDDEVEAKVIVPPNPGFSIEVGRNRKETLQDLAAGTGKPQPRQIRAAEGPLAAKNKKAFIKKFAEIAGGKAQGKTI